MPISLYSKYDITLSVRIDEKVNNEMMVLRYPRDKVQVDQRLKDCEDTLSSLTSRSLGWFNPPNSSLGHVDRPLFHVAGFRNY